METVESPKYSPSRLAAYHSRKSASKPLHLFKDQVTKNHLEPASVRIRASCTQRQVEKLRQTVAEQSYRPAFVSKSSLSISLSLPPSLTSFSPSEPHLFLRPDSFLPSSFLLPSVPSTTHRNFNITNRSREFALLKLSNPC